MNDIRLNSLFGQKLELPQNTNKQANNEEDSKSFMDMLNSELKELNEEQIKSDAAMSDIATGRVKDLHQAAIAINKAETSMKFMLEVRNKAINAYKEISRTQI
ncbi:flagellar hook-basal body complex protein FliE [Campylobacter canadensis]|uniref:Flagellar hook-basal body complex protein FliE n=1 Tax=Campylobacter canadensis TaxID=449520 RepID=A0ABS7WRR3_9BACT|nr:flagellar hook-basal body complex protein FliE [Campylobacter canadensis]MBZ7987027.1 flagellar hook-basal body complex protein FliE [Campylobacter canadensis]MBZ7994641.1 flagellar hook-basal body complex protein FliE [Campylobacter canadensis]MBZ7996137.1 flagellar hook-basal body complex protein FliE [Campylobacter canadensis]MBZ7998063.1 flagellar hook-basal body complex protein FliE [Campylobacter canadensis]MBZ8000047.1 flagellar hook-basal body complex protein FliE [Campylobacter can